MNNSQSQKGKIFNFQSSPLINSLVNSQTMSVLIFDSKGQILDYSEPFSTLFEIEKNYFLRKNIDILPLSKSKKQLILLDFKNGFAPSQKIYDVKLITNQGRVLAVNVNTELTFLNEELIGGIIYFEKIENTSPEFSAHNNLLSKSKFFLKEPLRISNHFAQKLEEEIKDNKPLQKEFLSFISSNISKLDCLINHLILLENLNIYHADNQNFNLENLIIIESQKEKAITFDFDLKDLDKSIYSDKELMSVFIKSIIGFCKYLTKGGSKTIRLTGSKNLTTTNLVFELNVVTFLNNPNFRPNLPINKIEKIETPLASGYELVIMDRIIKLTRGALKISINSKNKTEIEIILPNN